MAIFELNVSRTFSSLPFTKFIPNNLLITNEHYSKRIIFQFLPFFPARTKKWREENTKEKGGRFVPAKIHRFKTLRSAISLHPHCSIAANTAARETITARRVRLPCATRRGVARWELIRAYYRDCLTGLIISYSWAVVGSRHFNEP